LNQRRKTERSSALWLTTKSKKALLKSLKEDMVAANLAYESANQEGVGAYIVL